MTKPGSSQLARRSSSDSLSLMGIDDPSPSQNEDRTLLLGEHDVEQAREDYEVPREPGGS